MCAKLAMGVDVRIVIKSYLPELFDFHSSSCRGIFIKRVDNIQPSFEQILRIHFSKFNCSLKEIE